MIIGIDGNEANVEKQVGVSVYTSNLLSYFEKKADKKLQFYVFLREKPHGFLPPETKYFHYVVVNGTFLWSQIFLPFHLYMYPDLDVFFAPAHYAPRFLKIPLVVTIHDLAYFYYPEEFLKKDLYKLKNWTANSVNKAKKVIAVSKNTKNDLIKFYRIPKDKIEVVYNGYEKKGQRSKVLPADRQVKSQNTNSAFKSPYILYVGTLQPRKNVTILIKAFSKFILHNSEFKLIITGKKGWLYDEIFSLTRKLGLGEKIVFTGHVSDPQLSELYKHAFCYVLPSLYEGFGIPILEAMAQKCPVITSRSSSLPEVAGDACLYFDPNDDIQLLKQLTSLKTDEKLRQSLIQKGLKQVKKFSWEKCGEQTLAIFKNME